MWILNSFFLWIEIALHYLTVEKHRASNVCSLLPISPTFPKHMQYSSMYIALRLTEPKKLYSCINADSTNNRLLILNNSIREKQCWLIKYWMLIFIVLRENEIDRIEIVYRKSFFSFICNTIRNNVVTTMTLFFLTV